MFLLLIAMHGVTMYAYFSSIESASSLTLTTSLEMGAELAAPALAAAPSSCPLPSWAISRSYVFL